MSKSGIYYIKNILTDEYYIGQSMNINRRISQHFSDLKFHKHTNSALQHSYDVHGKNNFEWGILEEAPISKLNELESKYVEQYSAISNGFNPYDRGFNGIRKSEGVKKTQIVLQKSTKDALFEIKIYRHESYDDIVRMLINSYDPYLLESLI